MTEIKSCSRCSKGFYPAHGNQTVCGGCKAARPTELRRGVTRTFGERQCALCWREFTVVHLVCLIDDDPSLGRGLDLAREYGVADLDDDGEWVVGDLSRLERG